MLECKELYYVTIVKVLFKLNSSHSPYIDIVTKTRDGEELFINVRYYFTNKAKYFSCGELTNILESFGFKFDENDVMGSLNQLVDKTVYLLKVPEYENKYQVFKKI